MGMTLVGILAGAFGERTLSVQAEPLVAEEDINVIMEQGAEAGLLEESERETVSRLFRLSDRAVMALMKPRHDIVWLDVDAPAEQTMRQVVASSHSRFPVARGSLDNVVGDVDMDGKRVDKVLVQPASSASKRSEEPEPGAS